MYAGEHSYGIRMCTIGAIEQSKQIFVIVFFLVVFFLIFFFFFHFFFLRRIRWQEERELFNTLFKQ